MAQATSERRGDRLRRLRWRLRGAWLWPAFVVVTLLETALLRWLPLAGEGSRFISALLLAGSLNLIAVAGLGGLGGSLLRRRRRDMPKVVADNYAGLAALAVVAAAFVVAGLAHRPEIVHRREAFSAQSEAVRLWVDVHGDAVARAHVDAANTVRTDADLYRTCIPGADPKRWLCLVIDTSQSPPRVSRDRSRESNASLYPRGDFS